MTSYARMREITQEEKQKRKAQLKDFDIFMGEYWSSYTNFHFSLLKSSVLVITKILEKWLQLHKYEELPQHFSPILQSMDIIVPQRLCYFFNGLEYWLRYAHLYFTLLISGVLVFIKQQVNGSRSINMKSYLNHFSPILQSMNIVVQQAIWDIQEITGHIHFQYPKLNFLR